jgi:hypothetical protein
MLFKNHFRFNLFIFLVTSSVLFWTCKPSKSEKNQEGGELAAYETQEFIDFYEKFGADSVFQMEHVVFPLEGIKAVTDSTEIVSPDFKWQRENWIIHKPFDDMNGTFSREFLDIKGIVIEFISDNSGQFTMERRFGKLSSGWHMIYYREMGRY